MTTPRPRVAAVVGLGFGDEGKGATVDWLCASEVLGRPVEQVVRFNGGAQAAHNVVAPGRDPGAGPRHHTFHQFGAGTFSGVPTLFARTFMVEPIQLAAEAESLEGQGVADPLGLISADPQALITTPLHAAANRAREDARARRSSGRHGSCGQGIGETRWYDLAYRARLRAGDRVGNLPAPADVTAPPIRVHDCRDRARLIKLLDAMAATYRPLLHDSAQQYPSVAEMASLLVDFGESITFAPDGLRQAVRAGALFEGAQGVLLDEWRGFHPHTTWSTTEPWAVRRLVDPFDVDVEVIGVTRTFTTRHGAGPFPSEAPGLAVPERHNGTGEYQGAWRAGHLDLVLLRYALAAIGGVDRLAITHCDCEGPGLVEQYLTSDGVLTDLPVGRHGDLEHQAELTDLLTRCTPVVTAATVEERVAAITRAAQAPVLVAAAGPARADRLSRVGRVGSH